MSKLEQVLNDCEYLLLDFDGPICSVFANYPPEGVAQTMAKLVQSVLGTLPGSLERESDPMAILSWSARSNNHDLKQSLEAMLTEAEVQAVETAAPTPGAGKVIEAAILRGMRLAVVSNNSSNCIIKYLELNNLQSKIGAISARPAADPGKMKPDPFIIRHALDVLGAMGEKAVLIGDSLTDIEGARAAGVRVVALANKESKFEPFTAADPDALVQSMTAVADALRGR